MEPAEYNEDSNIINGQDNGVNLSLEELIEHVKEMNRVIEGDKKKTDEQLNECEKIRKENDGFLDDFKEKMNEIMGGSINYEKKEVDKNELIIKQLGELYKQGSFDIVGEKKLLNQLIANRLEDLMCDQNRKVIDKIYNVNIGKEDDKLSYLDVYDMLLDKLSDDQKNMSIKFNPFQPKNYKNLLNNIRHLYKTIQEILNYYEENKDYNVKVRLLKGIWLPLPKSCSPVHTTGNIIQDLYMYLDTIKNFSDYPQNNIQKQIADLFPDDMKSLNADKRKEYIKAYITLKNICAYQYLSIVHKKATDEVEKIKYCISYDILKEENHKLKELLRNK